MKMVKSLILGSAAAFVAMSGAQAADLPVKAKAVEYVKVCSLYGAGFWYIPGTDTCIKLGGYLRADATANGNVYDGPFWNGSPGAHDRYANQLNVRSRFALTVDTRTATEYGVVRTFAQSDWQFSTFGSSGSIGYASSLNPAANNGQLNNDTIGNGYVAVEFVFVQFAGFTFGKSASAYATPWHGYPGNNTSFLVGGYDAVTGLNNIQYTAQFGNGVSGTIGVDENAASQFNRTQIINAVGGPAGGFSGLAPGAFGTFAGAAGGQVGFSGACTAFYTPTGCAYGGTLIPDIVGNIKVDQAWGLFQFSAAAHQLRAGYYNNANIQTNAISPTGFSQVGATANAHPDDRWGGAVMAAIQIKNIPTGPGDDIKFDASYAQGASKYVIGTSSAAPSSFNIYDRQQRYAMGVTTDAIYSGASNPFTGAGGAALAGGLGNNGNARTEMQLTRSYGLRGAFNHNWSPEWSSSVFGGVARLDYNQTARVLYCNTYVANAGITVRGTGRVTNGGGTGGAFTAGSTCDPGFTVSEVGLVTRWTPVKNLTFSAEVLYAYLDTRMTGAVQPVSAATGGASGPSSALPLANQVYTFRDQGTLSGNFRVQRNF